MIWIYIDQPGTEREYPVHPLQQAGSAHVNTEVLLHGTGQPCKATYHFQDKTWQDAAGTVLPTVIAWRYPA